MRRDNPREATADTVTDSVIMAFACLLLLAMSYAGLGAAVLRVLYLALPSMLPASPGLH
jgi:hypothetical protein